MTPPKIAETEECAQRGCFRIADVTVIHSVTTSATGLTATVMGRGPEFAISSGRRIAVSCSLSVTDMAKVKVCLCVLRDKGVVGATSE